MTKTIQGVTYHQDPTDSDLWYDDPARLGTGAGWDTSELETIRSKRAYYERQITKATDDYDGACQIREARTELDALDEDIELLEALAG